MKKKIFLLIIITFIVTGCNVNYDITVDKDLKITEQLNVEESKDSFDIQYNSPKEGVESIFSDVNRSLKSKIDNYKIKSGLNNISFNINNKYSNESDFNNSNILKNLNGKVEVYKNPNSKSNTSIFQVMINYDFFDMINTNKYSTINIDEMYVNIKFPYKVISSNADSSKDDTYTWNLKRDIQSRSFYIEYDNNKTYQNSSVVTIIIIILIILLILLAFLFIILFAKKKKKNDL